MSKPKMLIQSVINDYINNKLTITECALKYNVVPSTVFVWVRKYNTNKEFRNKFDLTKNVDSRFSDIDEGTLKYTESDFKGLVDELVTKDIIIERFKKGYFVQNELEKSDAILLLDYQVIHILEDKYPVTLLCNKMNIARSNYYRWFKKTYGDVNNKKKKKKDQRTLYIKGLDL